MYIVIIIIIIFVVGGHKDYWRRLMKEKWDYLLEIYMEYNV